MSVSREAQVDQSLLGLYLVDSEDLLEEQDDLQELVDVRSMFLAEVEVVVALVDLDPVHVCHPLDLELIPEESLGEHGRRT